MSRFLSKTHASLKAYTPGEQPKTRDYIKLNTNESPFPPSPAVFEAALNESKNLNLYSDPEARTLTEKAASFYGVDYDQVLMTNGSDEILNFAFMAFGDSETAFSFPDITYGFYPVFAKLNHIPFNEIPLKDDFSIDVKDYENSGTNIVIANPNAPTGLTISLSDIERILITNPDNVVVIDEAYIDFGGETALPLLEKYENLLITRTFSKSYSLAGGRLGFGIGNKNLIADFFGYSVRNTTFHALFLVTVNEVFAFLCHNIRLFLGHGTTHQIAPAIAVARKLTYNLHYLLLIYDTAVCSL